MSIFSRQAKRGHFPRERGIRKIYKAAGIPLPMDTRVQAAIAIECRLQPLDVSVQHVHSTCNDHRAQATKNRRIWRVLKPLRMMMMITVSIAHQISMRMEKVNLAWRRGLIL